MKPLREYLRDMLKYISYLATFTAEGRATFDHDIKTQLAVYKAYEVVGEIAKRLPDSLINQHPEVRWKDLKGFRDILVHRYDEVDFDLVWKAVEDLTNLRAAVEAMLAELDESNKS